MFVIFYPAENWSHRHQNLLPPPASPLCSSNWPSSLPVPTANQRTSRIVVQPCNALWWHISITFKKKPGRFGIRPGQNLSMYACELYSSSRSKVNTFLAGSASIVLVNPLVMVAAYLPGNSFEDSKAPSSLPSPCSSSICWYIESTAVGSS